jgi:hypothetical protein
VGPLSRFELVAAHVGAELGCELDDEREIGAYGPTLPLIEVADDFAFEPLDVKGLGAMVGVMKYNNGCFNANVIANFHRNCLKINPLIVAQNPP